MHINQDLEEARDSIKASGRWQSLANRNKAEINLSDSHSRSPEHFLWAGATLGDGDMSNSGAEGKKTGGV